MRKYLALLVVLCGLLIPVAAIAATWDTTKNGDLVAAGAACEDGDDGAWYHFVNNQTDGSPAGTIAVTFFDASENQSGIGPLAVNRNVQHFYVFGESRLLTATTGALPGKLVISHIACGKFIDGPPRD